jgi:hypothetical protein
MGGPALAAAGSSSPVIIVPMIFAGARLGLFVQVVPS